MHLKLYLKNVCGMGVCLNVLCMQEGGVGLECLSVCAGGRGGESE